MADRRAAILKYAGGSGKIQLDDPAGWSVLF